MNFPDISDGTWETREIGLGGSLVEVFVKRFGINREAHEFVDEWHRRVCIARGAILIAPLPPAPTATAEQMIRWAEEGCLPAREEELWFEVFFVAPIEFESTLYFLDYFGFGSYEKDTQRLRETTKEQLRWVNRFCPIGIFGIQRGAVSVHFLQDIADNKFEIIFRKVFEFNRNHFSTEQTPEYWFSTWKSMNGVGIGPM